MSSEGAVTKAMEKVSTGRAVLLVVVPVVAMLLSRRIRGNTWTALYTRPGLHSTPSHYTLHLKTALTLGLGTFFYIEYVEVSE